MRILYLGDSVSSSTSAHRAAALRRGGHEVDILDLGILLGEKISSVLAWKIHYRTGYRFVQNAVLAVLDRHFAGGKSYDLAWVNGGEFLGRRALQRLRDGVGKIVLCNNDDPTGGRDGHRWDTLLRSLGGYDLCAVMREINVGEFQARGAGRVLRVWMSYDEVVHAPFSDPGDIPVAFRSEVSFVGTCMKGEHRDDFMAGLLERGLPVSIWGSDWQKSPRWSELRPYWRGPSLVGRDYVAALQGAKITIGLLSKGNRDLHTQRSLEVPYAGGLLCAERTSEHCELYPGGEAAVLWKDVEECACVCRELLDDPSRREKIRQAGMRRVRDLKQGNEDVCRRILDAACL